MPLAEIPEAVVGGALLFAVPGLAVARAIFPEWRFRGPDGLRRALETATLAFVLSIGLTVLVGGALLGLAPGGFAASWGDPLLEAILAAIAVVAFVVGLLEGAYARIPPARPAPEPDPGGEGAWPLSRALERLNREEARLVRKGTGGTADDARRLGEIRAERARLEAAREADYAR
ncbi:MAG TPA: hypothetical protein VMG36_04345 [Thermoplasmata archaeon]|nr:hypothetical protein [Thermoplasmata archaeon]